MDVLEDEMNMFERQIGDDGAASDATPAAPRPPVIAANTFTAVQDKLTKIATEAYGGGGAAAPASAAQAAGMFLPHQLSRPAGTLPPPPPPPPLPELAVPPAPALGTVAPPPPPPPGYVPPQFQPAGFVPPPPGYVRGPGPPPGWRGPAPPPPPPRPAFAPTVISSGPKVYASKPQLKRPAAEETAAAAPAPAPASDATPAAAAPAKKTKAAAMAEQVAASTTTVVDEGGPGGSGQRQKAGKQQANKKQKRPKKFIRTAGGQIWEDRSLHDWDQDDFRIFAGDLGNDVTEDVLTRYFSVYPSFVKAKVVRDKRSNKTKGYGFISFRESDDYVRAMKEMNGKYVGSRPIKLRKSQWRDRQIDVVRKKQKERAAFGLL